MSRSRQVVHGASEVTLNIPQLLEAIAGLAWPLLAAIVLWKLFPVVKDIAKSRAFTIKVGSMELSVQEATEQLRASLEDLQKKVGELRAQTGQAVPASVTSTAQVPAVTPRRVVWVDDNPANNAFEIARLKDEGVEVVQVTSTDEAMGVLVVRQTAVRAVISDMVRREGGALNWKAGVELIQQLRNAGLTVPIFIYGSVRAVEQTRNQALAVGGNGATSSSVELFELRRDALGTMA